MENSNAANQYGLPYSDVNNFLVRGNFYLTATKEENKLKYHIRKAFKLLDSINKKHSNCVNDLRIDLAMEDKNGALLINEQGHYKYTKENLKKLNRQVEDLFDVVYTITTITIPKGLIKENIDLTEEQKEIFSKFLLD
jgi:penicillin V acylase-like amidase (Ntn superfamily)